MKNLTLSLVVFAFFELSTNAQWQSTSLHYYSTYSLVKKGSDIYAGTKYGVYLTSDNGINWTVKNTGLIDSLVLSLAVNDSGIFAGTYGGLFFSSNKGGLWISKGLTNDTITALTISGKNIFAGNNDGEIFLSSNNGNSWTALSIGLTYNDIIETLVSKDSNIYVGCMTPSHSGGAYLSTNNGSTWNPINNGLTVSGVLSFAINGDTLFAGTWNDGMYLSTNNGLLWTNVNAGINCAYGVTSTAIRGHTVYAGTNECGVYFSTDNGSNWATTGFDAYSNLVLLLSGDTLFAGIEDGGVWFLPLTTVGIKEINNNAVNIVVYPNPVTDNLQIEFNSEIRSEKLELKIYDVVGNLVFEKSITANKATVDISSFPCGVYVVEVRTDRGIEVRKFVKE
jgi:hypothetical protein